MPFSPKYCTQIDYETEIRCTNPATHILKLGSMPLPPIPDGRISIFLCMSCVQMRVGSLPPNLAGQFTLTKIPERPKYTESRLKTPYLKQPRRKTYAPSPTPKSPEQLKLLREQFERALLSDKIRLRQQIIEYFGIDPLDLPG